MSETGIHVTKKISIPRKKDITSNPAWGAKVGRLNKVKDRLKNYIR